MIDALDYVNNVNDTLDADSPEEAKMKLAIYGEEKALEDYEKCLQVINECMSY